MSEASPRASRRRFFAYAAAVLVVGGVLAGWFVRRELLREGGRLQAERAAVRAQGEPLGRVELLGTELVDPAATLAWIEGFEEARSATWRPGELVSAHTSPEDAVESLLVRARREAERVGATAAERAALELDPAGPVARALAVTWAYDDGWPEGALGDGERDDAALAGLLARFDPEGLAYAERVREVAPLGRAELAFLLERERARGGVALGTRELPTLELIALSRRLVVAAHLAGVAGDVGRARDLLDASFAVGDLVRDVPLLLAHHVWLTCEGAGLGELHRLLRESPQADGWEALEARLAGPRPVAHLRAALVGERALVDETLLLLQRGELGAAALEEFGAGLARPGLLARGAVQRSHAVYLSAIREQLALLDLPWVQAEPGFAAAELRWAEERDTVQLMLLSQLGRPHELACAMEAERLLALAALRARREGRVRARVWVEGEVDPRTGGEFAVR
ncbi:MAG: hypothetical protein H6828_15660, partial [Planctomycetes bacterium]|nr:hypothetical protein [Planctomycetota bacterium]